MSDEVVREAKLFEVGKYPDYGMDATEADLDRLCSGTVTAPIAIEHVETPFDGALGVLRSVVRRGRELFGMLHFTPAAWELVKNAAARHISIHIAPGFARIVEVSLVTKPRIADAGFAMGLTELVGDGSIGSLLFSCGVVVDDIGGGGTGMADQDLAAVVAAAEARGRAAAAADVEAQFAEREKSLTRTIADLRRTDAKTAAGVKLAMWKAEGKLPPACEKFAEAILVDGVADVTFADGGHMPCADALVQLMMHMPRVVDIVGVPDDGGKAKFSAEDKKVFALLGVTEEEVLAADAAGNDLKG